MIDLNQFMKTEVKAMNDIWKAGFDEGRREAFKEMLPLITKLQDDFARVYERV